MTVARGAPSLARPRPRVHDPVWSYVMTSPAPDGHRHCARVNAAGRGSTAAGADGHVHPVDDLEVGRAAGHGHELVGERCPRNHDEDGRCL